MSEPIVEQALYHLLRSPRLSLSTILELLDVGDAEFRRLAAANPRLAELLEARKAGRLRPLSNDIRECPSCGEWFLPYGGARYCSDVCATIGRLRQH